MPQYKSTTQKHRERFMSQQSRQAKTANPVQKWVVTVSSIVVIVLIAYVATTVIPSLDTLAMQAQPTITGNADYLLDGYMDRFGYGSADICQQWYVIGSGGSVADMSGGGANNGTMIMAPLPTGWQSFSAEQKAQWVLSLYQKLAGDASTCTLPAGLSHGGQQ